MRTIRVKLLENALNPNLKDYYQNNIFLFLLRKKYNVVLVDDNPELLIYTLSHNSHVNYRGCKKIFHTEEPGFWNKNNYQEFYPQEDRFNMSIKDADLVLSSYYLNNDQNIRFPSYLLYYYQMILDGRIDNFDSFFEYRKIEDESLFDRNFCLYMHRNNSNNKTGENLFRVNFLNKLNKYKKVDIINIGGSSYDKTQFVKKYKFCFGMENNNGDMSFYPTIKGENKYYDIGYTTEKILEPFTSHSIPLYWGNQLIYKEFNTNMFINWHDFNDDEAMIEKIIELDNNKEKYMQYLNGNIFKKDYICNIFDEFLEKIEKIV